MLDNRLRNGLGVYRRIMAELNERSALSETRQNFQDTDVIRVLSLGGLIEDRLWMYYA